MIQKETFDGNNCQFTILDKQLAPVTLRRHADGEWSIELLIDLDILLNDGSERTVKTGRRVIRLAARQEGRKARKKKSPASHENNKIAKTLMKSLDQAGLLEE